MKLYTHTHITLTNISKKILKLLPQNIEVMMCNGVHVSSMPIATEATIMIHKAAKFPESRYAQYFSGSSPLSCAESGVTAWSLNHSTVSPTITQAISIAYVDGGYNYKMWYVLGHMRSQAWYKPNAGIASKCLCINMIISDNYRVNISPNMFWLKS